MIICGWCHAETPKGRCSACAHDAATPWLQRGQEPPTVEAWRRTTMRARISAAKRDIGPAATLAQIADKLEVSERTVRRWLEMSDA